jgi:hypothetical protein
MYLCIFNSSHMRGSVWKTRLGQLGDRVWRWELLRCLADVSVDGT